MKIYKLPKSAIRTLIAASQASRKGKEFDLMDIIEVWEKEAQKDNPINLHISWTYPPEVIAYTLRVAKPKDYDYSFEIFDFTNVEAEYKKLQNSKKPIKEYTQKECGLCYLYYYNRDRGLFGELQNFLSSKEWYQIVDRLVEINNF